MELKKGKYVVQCLVYNKRLIQLGDIYVVVVDVNFLNKSFKYFLFNFSFLYIYFYFGF